MIFSSGRSSYQIHVKCKKFRGTETVWVIVSADTWAEALEKATHMVQNRYNKTVIPYTPEEIKEFWKKVEKESDEGNARREKEMEE